MRRALIIIGVTVLLVGAATTALALNSTEESANTVAALQTQDDTTTPTTTEEAPARPCPAFLEGFRGQGGMGRGGIGLAELLGMEPAELRQAIAEGKTVPELAEERGIDLVAAHIAAAEERIATAEAEGRITAEQAAEMREHVQERAEAMANGEGFGQGGFRGHDRGRGFGFGAPDADGANAEGASIST